MNNQLLQKIQEIELLTKEAKLERAKKDPYFFLTRCCYTLDEHNKEHPYSLFPKKEYLRDLSDLFITQDLLAIEKSRQMLVTWWACGITLWFTMFHRPVGTRVFWLSKKEKDADATLDRIKIIYDHLDPIFKEHNPADEPFTYLKITWDKNKSGIWGLASGPDQVRQYTSSLIVMDEAAFQEKAEKVYEAVKPSLLGGGKLMMISSPNGKEYFYRCVKDLW